MAVSGSKDYGITRAVIIESALRKIGEFDQGESIPGPETQAADVSLNLIIKELVIRGADLFLREEVTLFLQPQTQSYSLGTAHATTSFVETTLSAAEAAAQTVLSITSTSGMTNADYIGIKLDDDSIHWTTVVVNSATQGTIVSALPSAAASGNKVYSYTTKAGRPQKILYAFRRDTSNFDTEVTLIGENEYRQLSMKSSEGPPTQMWYNPTLTTGTLHIWPVDGGSTYDKLNFISQVLPDDMDTAANSPQFPIEWGNTLVWRLAAELAYEYGLPRLERRELWTVAEAKLEDALSYDVENASVIFSMGRR